MIKKYIGIIGCGFIGQAVIKELVKNKNYNIRVLDRNPNFEKISVNWFEKDYRDKESISEFILDLDILIHLASSTVPASSSLSADIEIKENISAMVQLLDLVRKLNPDIYIILLHQLQYMGIK